MAIQFARVEKVGRSIGGNACRSSAYNARAKVVDERTGEVFDYSVRGGCAHHEVLLPGYVDKKFEDIAVLANTVERGEKRKDSQLIDHHVLALADDKNISLEVKIATIYRYIKKQRFIEEGLGVQINVHEPDHEDKNWHAHLLVSMRRFRKDGLDFEEKKATDLQPIVKSKGGRCFVAEKDTTPGPVWRDAQNEVFEELGLPNRVDVISTVPQEHIGPVRMRNMMNRAADRNEIRKIRHLENISTAKGLLEAVSWRQSVFTRRDLEIAAGGITDFDLREKLVAEALGSKDILRLYDKEEKEVGEAKNKKQKGRAGQDTEYFTTKAVRLEEERIMRIASAIKTHENFTAMPSVRNSIRFNLESEGSNFSEQQGKALEHLLCGAGGVRILRGRAGTGKSHVLGRVSRLAGNAGARVVGLSPTNKAAVELSEKGFAESYTVKWFLFALKNGRVSLARNSLIVLDEAGMLGNSDLQELLRVTRSYKCNLIMAGDERQLTSVERGGVFEVLAREFGSVGLSQIRRQSEVWSRQMAEHFSRGEMLEGLKILEKQRGIFAAKSQEGSVLELLSHWGASSFALENRLMITVANKEVDALNDGAREYLKKIGHLEGEKISIERKEKVGEIWRNVRREFMAGDRVLFTANNKALKVQNGDFGTLIKVSKDEFKVELDKERKEGQYITFNPAEIEGLKYGYAVTTYKSQGASIKDVYNLHSGIGNMRSGYVNLTRHVDSLKLFYNQENTRNIEHLAAQLERLDEKSSSLNFATREDLTKELEQELGEFLSEKEESVFGRATKWLKNTATALSDRLHSNPSYYKFDTPEQEMARVEEVLEEVYEVVQESYGLVKAGPANDRFEEVAIAAAGGRVVAGGVRVQGKQLQPRLTAKQRFYDRADRSRGLKQSRAHAQQQSQHQKLNQQETRDYAAELESLKNVMSRGYDRIALDLLGAPNKKLSSGKTLKYGSKGSLVVTISGPKAGTWYDFEAGEGGDIISLVQREKGLDFKGAADYLKDFFRVSKQVSLKLVHDNEVSETYNKTVEQVHKEDQKQAKDQFKVNHLFEKSKNITAKTVASRYLRDERKVVLPIEEGSDLRTTGIWVKEEHKYYPAVIAFARSKEGSVTGGQSILLDSESGKKAELDVAKRSFGRIAGSFVHVKPAEVSDTRDIPNRVTFIAEGLETALSIKEAGVVRDQDQILCSLGIGNIKNYQPKEGERILICADNDGDTSKTASTIEKAKELLESHGAIVSVTRPQELGDFNDVLKKAGAGAVQEVLLSPSAELRCVLTAKEQRQVSEAQHFLKNSAAELKEAMAWGAEVKEDELLRSILPMDYSQRIKHIGSLRNEAIEKGLKLQMQGFAKEKAKSENLEQLKTVIRREQNFLKATYSRIVEPLYSYPSDVNTLLRAGKNHQEHPDHLEQSFKLAGELHSEQMREEWRIMDRLKRCVSSKDMLEKLEKEKEEYLVEEKWQEYKNTKQRTIALDKLVELTIKEQKHLAGLYGNIKHLSHREGLTEAIGDAHLLEKSGNLNMVKEIVDQAINIRVATVEEVMKALKEGDNIKAVIERLDKANESCEIKNKLEDFNKALRGSKTPEESTKVLAGKAEYLASLKGNLKYQDHPENLMLSIEEASSIRENNKPNVLLEEVHSAVAHIRQHNIAGEEEIIKTFRASPNLKVVAKALTQMCEQHHLEIVKSNIAKINKGWEGITIGKTKFTCPVKYLEHEIKNPAHHYANVASLNKLHQQLQKQLEMQHELGGPRL